jgi:hypothetical protein
MKRIDILMKIREKARELDIAITEREGGSHTKLTAIFLMLDIPKNEIELKIESPIPHDFPQSYLQFRRREIINRVRLFLRMNALHPSPSADGK